MSERRILDADRYRLSNWEFKCGTATEDDYHLGLFSDETVSPLPSKREFISLNLLQTFIYRGYVRFGEISFQNGGHAGENAD